MKRSTDGDVSETSVAQYHVAEVDGIPYSYEYTHDTTLPVGVDDAFDMWINEVWVGVSLTCEVQCQLNLMCMMIQGGFPPSKVPFVLEKEGQGRGREGSIRRAYYGLLREEILQVGSRQPSPSSGTKHDGKPRIRTVLYQAPTMPLPFHHYKGLVRFIPQGDDQTLIRWSGKLAPKRWDMTWFGGLFASLVFVLFRFAVGQMVTGWTVHATTLSNKAKKRH
ncbi:hypothetical protein DYB36_005579 [Aphanomyces astaci]|uniref:Uncharacterized protein n=1 Tax=Aphanomyces astaci TaxID=112090 RepID=A0A397AGE9_APHAT|nr:hypothetical protein DYB36_005579 [Aphanomyces astaci]